MRSPAGGAQTPGRIAVAVGVIAAVLVWSTAGCAPARPAWAGGDRPFRIGVYLNNQAPIEEVFRELADAGVDLVWIGGGNYEMMTHRGLHRLAHAYGIDIYLQLFAEPRLKHPPDKQRQRIRDALDTIERQPHPEAVVAYAIGDEIEMHFRPDKFPDIERTMREFVTLIREQDTQRKTVVNHHGTYWYDCGEDELWASAFYRIPEGSAAIDWRLDQARYLGHRSFMLVVAAQSLRQGRVAERLPFMGLAHVGAPAIRARTPRQDVRDYLLTAYAKGAAGCVAYIFDGKPNDQWSLTDEHLRDGDGKWAGFRDGADAIKHKRGEPVVRVRWPWRHGETITEPARIRVEIRGRTFPDRIVWEHSADGGLNWRRLGFGPSVAIDPAKLKLPPTGRGLVRVRPFSRGGQPWHFRVSPFFHVAGKRADAPSDA